MDASPTAPDDFVARLRRAWAQTLPGVDTSTIETMGRIGRISAFSTQQLDRLLAPAGVSRSEFDVLCALARSPHPLRASEVTAQTMLSGAATTKLAARLESAGLIRRGRLERDGRVVMLSLTPAGRHLVESELPRLLDHDQLLLDGLNDAERDTLVRLLRRITENAERAREV